MDNYTEEQLAYINYDGIDDTKLLACAGSGKTRCIIARIDYLVSNKIFNKNEVLMLTFSRLTRDDFMKKIESYKAKNVSKNIVKTIDSFAKSLIDKDNNIDVSLLSFKFMKYLEDTKESVLKEDAKLNKIKSIFVDEAQDLNETQYKIFVYMKTKLGVQINLVGDPNQNIYQFRGSSDKYIKEFKAKVFKLTKNFRSKESVVNFSKYLRPFSDSDVVCTQGVNECQPIMTFHDTENSLEENLIGLLKEGVSQGNDLSDFAILSPTRGRMRGYGKSHGLCLVSNILNKNGIKFKQFYEESTDEVSGGGIKYMPTKGHVNILTYMGSKGLEWKYVIIVDADMCLINKRYFDSAKHDNDRYLLYVACSRAIESMYIFSKYTFKHGAIEFNTNPWFNVIPKNMYYIDKDFKSHFMFPRIQYRDMGNKERRITKIIDRMDEYALDELSTIISYDKKKLVSSESIYQDDYSKLETQHSIFLGKFTEFLFHALCDLKMKKKHKSIPDIENIIDSVIDPKNIMENVPYDVTEWYYSHRNGLTWSKFDKEMTVETKIREYINKHFCRTKELHEHTIINDSYFKFFVLSKREWIRNSYQKYMDCEDKDKMRKYAFNIVILLHSFDTQHYFHIRNKGIKFTYILKEYDDMFDELEFFVDNISSTFIEHNVTLSKWGIVGEADMIDDNNNIWEIKCVGELTLKHFLQVIMYNIIHHGLDVVQYPCCDVKFINLLKGEILEYKFRLSRKKIGQIIEIFQKTGDVLTDYNVKESDIVDNKTKELIRVTKAKSPKKSSHEKRQKITTKKVKKTISSTSSSKKKKIKKK
jgi:hypothetical protein